MYIGTVVGAGFASGQEIMRFFSLFGHNGQWGILAASLLLAAFGVRILLLGSALGAQSYLPVLRAVAGPGLSRPLDWLITFFLFAALTAMVAATGAACHEAWGLPVILGNLTMAGAAAGTVLLGLRGVLKAVSWVAPLLIASTAGIGVAAFLGRGPATGPGLQAVEVVPVAPAWPLAAVLYVSFNLVGAIAVLAPLGGAARRRSALLAGGILGALGLGLAAMSIHLAFAGDLPGLQYAEVPMVRVAARLGPGVGEVYSGILLLEVYTTAVASLFGLSARLGPVVPGGFGPVTLAGAAGSLFASQLGFATLIATVYPLVGVGGLILLLCLARPVRVYSHL